MRRRPGIDSRPATAASTRLLFVALDRRPADRLDVVDGRRQADRFGRGRRAGLEAARRIVVGRRLEGDAPDHAAAALPGRHRGEELPPPVERADAGRTVDLVAREGEEVAAERGDVDPHVGGRLGAVDEHRHAGSVRAAHQVGHRQHRAERVRDVREGGELRARPEPARELLRVDFAAVVDRHDDQIARRAPRRPSARGRGSNDARAR